MARSFNGTTDRLHCSIGGLSGMTYGTTATIFTLPSAAASRALADVHTSGGTFRFAGQMILGGGSAGGLTWFSNTDSKAPTNLSANTWYCAVTRKDTGTVAARHSWYNYTAGTWTHEAGGGTANNATSGGAGGTIRFDVEGSSDVMDGSIAVRAMWANSLPWSADTTGDALIEASGLPFSLMAWYATAPTGLWVFDQADTGTNVIDLTGGGANQSSLTGTTVSTSSVPVFSYGLPILVGGPASAAVANPNAECATATGTGNNATVTVPAEPTMTLLPVTTGLRLN